MKQEVLIIGGIVAEKFARRDCPTCGPDTLFKGYKCAVCGWCRPLPVVTSRTRARFHTRTFKGENFAKRISRGKAAERRAQAEASRAMFEGKKP